MSSFIVVLFQVMAELPEVLTTVIGAVPLTVNAPVDVAAYPAVRVNAVGPVMVGATGAGFTVSVKVVVASGEVPLLAVNTT
jgi:hypothetical protein